MRERLSPTGGVLPPMPEAPALVATAPEPWHRVPWPPVSACCLLLLAQSLLYLLVSRLVALSPPGG